jgi:Aminoglycoside/hydroxyurea antibiotic resistance kinase
MVVERRTALGRICAGRIVTLHVVEQPRYRRRTGSIMPGIDAGARQRLTARFGSDVAAWFDQLPGVLAAVGQRWQFELGASIPRGSVSAVFWCQLADGRRAVLKASPDRARLAFEAAALSAWHTVHTPAVIAFDEQLGALLIEAIEPGTPLVIISAYPAMEDVAELLSSLHASGVPRPVLPGGGTARRQPVRLLGQALPTPPEAGGADPAAAV